jgi:DNA processing protein
MEGDFRWGTGVPDSVAVSANLRQDEAQFTMESQFKTTIEDLLGPLNEVERKNAPKALFFAGDLGLLDAGPRVSIVGSRKASARGLNNARGLAAWLVRRGAVVVSGLAEGIDAAAHQGAIDAGGRTIGVIGTPLNQSYPPKNRQLQALLASEHLVLSQFADGSPVQPKNFPIRNRTMALISHATIIVEAADKSGSLHQGWEALRLGRPLFVLERLMNDPSLSWPKELAHYGALSLDPDGLEAITEYLPEHGRADLAHIEL